MTKPRRGETRIALSEVKRNLGFRKHNNLPAEQRDLFGF